MKTYPTCIPCIIRQSEFLISTAVKDNNKKEALRKIVNEYLETIEIDKVSPPEIANSVYDLIHQQTGVLDPFKHQKIISNQEMMKLREQFLDFIHSQSDPVATAIRLSALANVIDHGISSEVPSAMSVLQAAVDSFWTLDDTSAFLRQLSTARSLLYIFDNCGEVVLDMILIEILQENFPNVQITGVVRGGPIINDVTLEDAKFIGLDRLIPLIDTGRRLPGIPANGNPLFHQAFDSSDIVLAKGQGNFESNIFQREVFHIFKVKCDVVAWHLGIPKGSLVFFMHKGGQNVG